MGGTEDVWGASGLCGPTAGHRVWWASTGNGAFGRLPLGTEQPKAVDSLPCVLGAES